MDQKEQIDDIINIKPNNEDEDKQFDLKLYFILEIVMLSPIIWVVIFFWFLHEPLSALSAFQIITLCLFPYFIANHYKMTYFNDFFQTNLLQQVVIGIPLALISFTSLLFCVVVMCEYTNYINFDELSQNKPQLWSLILCGIFLCLTNPFLEELFWRSFLYKFYDHSEINKWWLSFHYALYHFFVLYKFTNYYQIALVGLVAVTMGGRVFAFVRFRWGLIAASLFHQGADLGIVAGAAYYYFETV